MWHSDSNGKTMRKSKFTTNFMSKWVVNSKESIGEGHTSECCSIVHVFASFLTFFGWMSWVIVIRLSQVFKDKFDGLKWYWFCIVRRHDRNIRFKRVWHGINPRPRNSTFWYSHNKLRVNNGNLRCQLIVSKWIFNVSFIISDNRKWSHFRTSTRSSRDSNHLCFVWVVEFDNTFTNINKFLS